MRKGVILMKIQTKFLGEVEVSENHIIEFKQGLPAFEEETEFIIVPFDEGTPFYILQSIKSVDVSFLVVDPFTFFHDFKVKIPDASIEMLEIEKEEDVAIFVILTIHEPFTKTTANLQAPVIINAKKQKGKQLVLPESGYHTKHYIMPQSASSKEEVKK